MRADSIIRLLAAKHTKDVFVSECKMGPSMGLSCPRLDAWAMKRSYANPCYYGYEVKVARSDFVNDEKWPLYLPACNVFSFVCPHGLIATEEIPEGCGLLWTSKTGTRLYTKRRAPRRIIDEPIGVLLYVLMSRTIVGDEYAKNETRAYWEKWLKERKLDMSFGHRVSQSIRQTIDEHITKVKRENAELKAQNDAAGQLLQILQDLGISPATWDLRHKVRKALAAHNGGELAASLKRVAASMTQIAEVLNAT